MLTCGRRLGRRTAAICRIAQFPSPAKYTTSRFRQIDPRPEEENRDDDEFLFPVQLSFPSAPHEWLWSGADITRLVDLGSDAFHPERKMLYSSDSIKIMSVKHRKHGDMIFTLIQDQTKLWKICNIATFGDTNPALLTSSSISSDLIDMALGSMLDLLNDKEQTMWMSSPALDIFSNPYQYVCAPYSIKISDSIGKLIKLAEGDRESYLPSCFKLPVSNSDEEHCKKISENSNIKVNKKILMQCDNLALVLTDVFAYDRVGMIDAVFEILVLLETGTMENSDETQSTTDDDDDNILSFTSDGRAIKPLHDSKESLSVDDVSPEKYIKMISLMIGKEHKKGV
jgi:hypothetical protein